MQSIKKIFTLLNILIFPVILSAQIPFITTWKTDNPGTSASNQITIPTGLGTFNYDVDWENDGVYDDFGVSGNISHTYPSAGIYQVAIKGTFPHIQFENIGDKDKILSIDQWGDIEWGNMLKAFKGCSNLVCIASDTPDLSVVFNYTEMFNFAHNFTGDLSNWDVSSGFYFDEMFWQCQNFNSDLSLWNTQNAVDMRNMFLQCSSFNSNLSNWNTSSVEDMNGMFGACIQFNQNVSSWNTSSVEDMNGMFFNCQQFDQDLSSWDVSLVTNFTSFLDNTDMSITNYDALLSTWSNLPSLQTNINFGAINLEYCNGSMDRQELIDDFNWSFIGDSENCTTCSHPDYDVMIDLYTSTNGVSWTNNTGWIDGLTGTNCDPCSWYGVTCNANNRVTELDLFTNGLTGTLPSNIGDLELLTKMYLYSNTISGSIPSSIGDLVFLEVLSIYNNELTGSISPTIGQLDNLTYLSLSGNNLSGIIPVELGDMDQLLTLSLWDNQLTGSIPVKLSTISSLFHLSLSNNMLSGSIPSELGGLLNLNYIRLDNNMLSGSIPNSLGNLTNVNQFWLANNQLTGTIPSSFSGLTSTVEFMLNNNMLEGCIPASLQNICSNVQFADISGNPDLDTQSWDDFCNNLEGQCSSYAGNCLNYVVSEYFSNENHIVGYDKDLAQSVVLYSTPDQIGTLTINRETGWIYFITTHHMPSTSQMRYKIERVSTDGLVHEVVLDNILSNPNYPMNSGSEPLQLTNYEPNNELYMIIRDYLGEPNGVYSILSCGNDGSNLTVIHSQVTHGGISIDPNTSKLFYRDNFIYSSDLDGTNINLIIAKNGIDMFIEQSTNKLYYSDFANNELGSCNLDGSNLEIHYTNFPITTNIEYNYNNNSVIGFGLTGVIEYNLQGGSATLSSEVYQLVASNKSSYWNPITGCDQCDANNYNPQANSNDGTCESCSDGIQNGDETGIDCGGTYCAPCCDGASISLVPTEYTGLEDFYILLNGGQWTNTINDDFRWFEDCDPCGEFDGTPWKGIVCNLQKTSITDFYLPNNNLSGSIPSSIGSFSNLIWLYLSNNQISGEIPLSICNLTYLEHPFLSNNQLTGEIPTCVADLLSLSQFSVSNNNLSGSLPAFGSQNLLLSNLNFDNNNFTGSIPSTWGDLPEYVYMRLNDNNLDGCYSYVLNSLCRETITPTTNEHVSDGNSFDEPWESFCAQGLGACCEDHIILDLGNDIDGHYYARESITLRANLVNEDSVWLHTKIAKIENGSSSLDQNSLLVIDREMCLGDAALNLDGINDFINLPSYSTDDDLTISLWFKMDGSNTTDFDNRLFSILDVDGGGQQFEIGVAVNDNNIWMYEVGNGTSTFGPTVNDNQWHQLTIVREGTLLDIYLDGQVINSLPNADTNWGDEIFLGRCGCGGSGHYFDGDMDDFYLFPDARSQEYIEDTLFCSEYDLVDDAFLYYSFDDKLVEGDNSASTILADQTGSGNNADMINFNLNGSSSNFVEQAVPISCCTDVVDFTCQNITVNLIPLDIDLDGTIDEGGYAYVLARQFTSAENTPCGQPLIYSYSTDFSDTLRLFNCLDFGPPISLDIYGKDILGNIVSCTAQITVTDNTPLCDGQ